MIYIYMYIKKKKWIWYYDDNRYWCMYSFLEVCTTETLASFALDKSSSEFSGSIQNVSISFGYHLFFFLGWNELNVLDMIFWMPFI